jgi:hypothetical protein
VQSDFGGKSRLADPPAFVIQHAIRAVQAVAPTLSARVDGVVDHQSQFRIMELELIEPALFLTSHPPPQSDSPTPSPTHFNPAHPFYRRRN